MSYPYPNKKLLAAAQAPVPGANVRLTLKEYTSLCEELRDALTSLGAAATLEATHRDTIAKLTEDLEKALSGDRRFW